MIVFDDRRAVIPSQYLWRHLLLVLAIELEGKGYRAAIRMTTESTRSGALLVAAKDAALLDVQQHAAQLHTVSASDSAAYYLSGPHRDLRVRQFCGAGNAKIPRAKQSVRLSLLAALQQVGEEGASDDRQVDMFHPQHRWKATM